MISLINTLQFIANQQIKTAFCNKWYHTYHNSMENLNQFIDKFTEMFYSVSTNNKLIISSFFSQQIMAPVPIKNLLLALCVFAIVVEAQFPFRLPSPPRILFGGFRPFFSRRPRPQQQRPFQPQNLVQQVL